MSLITWNDYFVTGIDIIDEQHRWLIGLINEAAPVLVQPHAVSHETADRLLDQLTEYAVFHFQTEARLMADNGIDSATAITISPRMPTSPPTLGKCASATSGPGTSPAANC